MTAGIGVVVFIYIGIFTEILKTGSQCRKRHSYKLQANNQQQLFNIIQATSHKKNTFSPTRISP
jgi:hypothetical protein